MPARRVVQRLRPRIGGLAAQGLEQNKFTHLLCWYPRLPRLDGKRMPFVYILPLPGWFVTRSWFGVAADTAENFGTCSEDRKMTLKFKLRPFPLLLTL